MPWFFSLTPVNLPVEVFFVEKSWLLQVQSVASQR